MRKPLRFEIRFLRFLAKPLQLVLLLTLIQLQVQAQSPTGLVTDDCICLSNQSYSGNGQFQANLEITSLTGEIWYIDDGSAQGLYPMANLAPPSIPLEFTTGSGGFILTESPAASGTYIMSGRHVDGQGFSITLTNGVDLINLDVLAGNCKYPLTALAGDDFVCENQFSAYSTPNILGNAYIWGLSSGGSFVGPTNGSAVNISWGEDNPGPHALSVTEFATNGCIVNSTIPVVIEDTIALACNNSVQVSLNVDCEGVLTADMFLEDPQYENDSYEISLSTLNGQPLPGNVITSDYIGEQLVVSVIHSCSSNMCWSYMTVEDKIDPVMNCVTDTVRCDDSFDPEVIGFPVVYLSAPLLVAPNTYSVQGPDLCGPLTLIYHDDTIQNPCLDEFASFVVRRWEAIDGAGNTSVCEDTIKTTRTSLADLTYPANWDGQSGNNPVLDACGTWPKLPNGYPDPSFTGYPDGPLCNNISIDFTDLVLSTCGENSYKILRKWFVMDMCTSEVFDKNQIIAVMDNDAPVVLQVPNFEAVSNSYDCLADVDLPVPVIENECNSWTYTVAYKNDDEFGNPPPASDPYITDANVRFNADGTYTLLGLELGRTYVKYTITDACLNNTVSYFEILISDGMPPVAICDQHVVVSLNNDGFGYAAALSFDDGSWDNCGDISYQVRRAANECGVPANQWLKGVEFCCADIGADVMVELLVTDEAGLTNSCMALVEVQDKRAPAIYCPPNITVGCDFFISDYSIFGTVVTDPSLAKEIIITDPSNMYQPGPKSWGFDGVASDNCDVEVEILYETANLNECGVGTIKRGFQATDPNGATQFCEQTISVVDFDPFYINDKNPNDTRDDVVWPKDYVLHGCLDGDTDPSSLPDGYNEPVILDDDCSLVAFDYDDVVFQYVDGYCYKIVRTWYVIDWCQFDQTNPYGNGYWEYNQLIMVVDDELPVFTSGCEATPLVNQLNDDGCSATVKLSAEANDNCTASEDLVFNYKIDLDSDGDIDKSGFGNTVTGNYEYGSHKIFWYVEDECGNVNECYRKFVVEDNKKPTPICYEGLVTVPMPTTGTVEIFAKSFNICNGCESGSYDNCTPKEELRFSFSSDVNYTSRVFSCDDIANGILDTIDIEMWVTDLAGNQEYCNTYLILQDNQDICLDVEPDLYDIAGMVMTPDNQALSSVSVKLETGNVEYTQYSTSNNNGVYSFNDVYGYQNYELTASSNENPMGGVSTLDLVLIQKHLLGLKNLETPYKLIAADVNGSGSVSAADLLDLRKLILGIYDELPHNDSYRFVDASQEFANPSNPFPFDEIREIEPLRFHSLQNNFIAVKIGDVNNSLQLTGGELLDERSLNKIILSSENSILKAGEQIDIDLYLNNELNVLGAQFTLKFDIASLDLIGIESDQIQISENNYSMHLKDNGLVTVSWNNSTGVEINTDIPVMTLKFNSTMKGRLSDVLQINSEVTQSEIYFDSGDSKLETEDLVLRFENEISADEMYLYQNRPNPFTNETSIAYYIPETQDAILSVYDLDGKLIYEVNNKQSKGYGEFIINNNSKIFTTGLYYYKLQAGDEVSTRKMIMIR